jgi:hypothetical protein
MHRSRFASDFALLLIPLALLVPAASARAQASASPTSSSDKIAFARPTASVELTAEPSKVWKKLVSSEGLGAFGVTAEKKKSLEKVGDNMRVSLSGETGTLVVTYATKDADWRAVFEPEKGDAVRTVRFQLKAQGNNTILAYSDWYSAEQTGTTDQELKGMEKTMKESLARFKGLVEKTSASSK